MLQLHLKASRPASQCLHDSCIPVSTCKASDHRYFAPRHHDLSIPRGLQACQKCRSIGGPLATLHPMPELGHASPVRAAREPADRKRLPEVSAAWCSPRHCESRARFLGNGLSLRVPAGLSCRAFQQLLPSGVTKSGCTNTRVLNVAAALTARVPQVFSGGSG